MNSWRKHDYGGISEGIHEEILHAEFIKNPLEITHKQVPPEISAGIPPEIFAMIHQFFFLGFFLRFFKTFILPLGISTGIIVGIREKNLEVFLEKNTAEISGDITGDLLA